MTADPESNPKPEGQPSGAFRSSRAEALLGSAPDEQISAAVAAEKWARAADLLESHGERLLLDGGVGELTGWLEALPDDYVSRNAKVAALFAWVRIYDQRYQDALRHLSIAERALQRMRLGEASWREETQAEQDEVELRPFAELEQSLAAIRLHLKAVDGGTGALPEQVEEIMIPASGDHPMWRAGALVILGRSRYLAGDLRGAEDSLETAHVLATSSRGARATAIAADAGVLLGRVAEARGKLLEAARRYDEVLADAPEGSSAGLAAEVGHARLALLRLDAAGAAARLERVKGAEGARIDPVRVVLESGLCESLVLAIEGRFDEAREALDALERVMGEHKLRWPLELIGAQRARTALLKRDESQAKRWLQQVLMHGAQAVTSPISATMKVVEALVQAALHAPKAALEAAREALAWGEESGHRRIYAEALAALALAHYGAGARDDARSALLAALEAVRGMGGALLPLFVRGISEAAAELGVEAEELTRVGQLLPPLPARSSERNETGQRPSSHAAGPIETSQVAPGAPIPAPASAEGEESEPQVRSEARAEG